MAKNFATDDTMEGTNPALQHLLGAIMACTVQVR